MTEEPGQIGIKQSRYLSTGDVEAKDDDSIWWVPLGLRGKVGVQDVAAIAFTEKENFVREVDNSFYKLNTDNAGFYRTNYPPTRLARLGTQVDRLSLSDKIGTSRYGMSQVHTNLYPRSYWRRWSVGIEW